MKLKALSFCFSGGLFTLAPLAAAPSGNFDFPAVTPSTDVRVPTSATAPAVDKTLLARPLPQSQTPPVPVKQPARNLPENLLPAVSTPAAASPSSSTTPIALENTNPRQVEQLLRAMAPNRP